MTNPNEAAFPRENYTTMRELLGLTKREYFAAMAMQGQITFEGMEGCDKEQIVGMSVELAEALIAVLNKEPK
jgi:hypothetical protein